MGKSLTEIALLKQQEAHRERLACERYRNPALNFRAERLESEAAELLKLDHAPVIGVGGEVVEPQVTGLPCNQAIAVNTLQEGATRSAEDASLRRMDLLLQPSFNAVALAVDAAESIKAENSLEKMLAHQMAVAHEAGMRLMDRALGYEAGGRTMRQGDSVEACRLANSAARLMSVYQDGLLTLQRLRTGGKQLVTVQHVTVGPGGQAVIGNVQTRGAKRRGSNGKQR